MRVTSRHHTAATPAVTAETLLGSAHPLARAADRRRSLRRQIVGVGIVLLGGVAVQLTGLAGARSLITVTVMVGITLAGSLLLVAKNERRLARALIITGRDTTPLPVVAWERYRLLDARYRYRLAASLDRIVRTAESPRWLMRGSRPLFRIQVVAAVSPQLSELAAALRTAECTATGIAMTQRLLCDGESPLYSDDIVELRQALQQVRSRLTD